ncbi:MAG: cytosine permease [Pseudomonadota bacterium]|nr:cytosine permease [Pseudomonadota bacterium]
MPSISSGAPPKNSAAAGADLPPGFERHGIESIPDADRTSSVWDFLRVCWGGGNSLATAVLGAFPIMFGLSFWQAMTANALGVAVGALVLGPMAVFGPLNGTNNAVSSSAHFGVVGRIVGSFLSLLTAIAFFSISVWSSGDAVVGAAHALFGVSETDGWFAAAYGVFAASVLVVCIYGYGVMLLVNKVAVVASSVLFIVGLAAFWPLFDSHFAGTNLMWGAALFWPPFVSASLVALSNPISFGAFLGDWSRYLPRGTDKGRLVGATVLAQLLTLLPFSFGTMTASIIARHAPAYLERADYSGGLLAVSPGWFFVPLFLLALLSGMSTGTTSLYGTGLDFSSVFPRLSRARATLTIGLVSCALIFVGRFAFTIAASVTTFVSLIVVTTTPWMVIMMIGYVARRGYYLPEAMQVFNRGQVGGPYWFNRGWNVPGVTAWIICAVVALLMVNSPGHFVGVLAHLAGSDLDLSLLAALLLPAVLYPLCLYLYPEPRAVFGPDGPRWFRAVNRPIAPIVPAGASLNP